MAADRPNVLLVLTDQERYDVTDPEGPPVETPAFDRRALRGRDVVALLIGEDEEDVRTVGGHGPTYALAR